MRVRVIPCKQTSQQTFPGSRLSRPREPIEKFSPSIKHLSNVRKNGPKISRVSLKVGRSESVVRTCDNSAHLSSPPLPVFIKPGVVRRQIGGGEVKEKNEAKRQAKVSKGGNCGWTDEPPRRSLSRREPALFVPILRNATRFILQTHYARIDKNETERKHRPREREIEGWVGGRVREKYHPGHPLDIPRQVRACIRARTRQIDVYRRGMRLGSSSISGAYSGGVGCSERCEGRWWIDRDDVPARDKCNEKSRVFIGHGEKSGERGRKSRLERTSDEMKQR